MIVIASQWLPYLLEDLYGPVYFYTYRIIDNVWRLSYLTFLTSAEQFSDTGRCPIRVTTYVSRRRSADYILYRRTPTFIHQLATYTLTVIDNLGCSSINLTQATSIFMMSSNLANIYDVANKQFDFVVIGQSCIVPLTILVKIE